MVSLERAVQILNDLLKADPIGIDILFNFRVEVNQQICDHPTVQVLSDSREPNTGKLGPLGLLNGLVTGDSVIIMELDEPLGKITEFKVGWLKDGKVICDK